MTSTETIRSALARLWDAGANAYELAQAVMKAADIESADLELEVESVIARALLAREFVDVAKVAEGVAKVLPRALPKLPPMEDIAEAIHLVISSVPFTQCEEAAQEVMRLLRRG